LFDKMSSAAKTPAAKKSAAKKAVKSPKKNINRQHQSKVKISNSNSLYFNLPRLQQIHKIKSRQTAEESRTTPHNSISVYIHYKSDPTRAVSGKSTCTSPSDY
jgi:hypothetical protein